MLKEHLSSAATLRRGAKVFDRRILRYGVPLAWPNRPAAGLAYVQAFGEQPHHAGTKVGQ